MYIFCSTYIYVHIFFSSFSVPFFYLCSSFVLLFSTPLWKKEKNYCVEERKKNCVTYIQIFCSSFVFLLSTPQLRRLSVFFFFFPLFFCFPLIYLCSCSGTFAEYVLHIFFFFFFFLFSPLLCALPLSRAKELHNSRLVCTECFFFLFFFCFFPWKKCCTYWSSYARNDFFFFFFFFPNFCSFFQSKSATHVWARMHGMSSFLFLFFPYFFFFSFFQGKSATYVWARMHRMSSCALFRK